MEAFAPLVYGPDQSLSATQLITALLDGESVLITAPSGTAALFDAAAPILARARVRVLRPRSSRDLFTISSSVVVSGNPRSDQGVDALTVLDPTCDRIALLIDNAHLLSQDALHYIEIVLSAASSLCVALAGRPELLRTLEKDEFSGLRQRLGLHLAPAQPPPRVSAKPQDGRERDIMAARMEASFGDGNRSPSVEMQSEEVRPSKQPCAAAQENSNPGNPTRRPLAWSLTWLWGGLFGLVCTGVIALQLLGPPLQRHRSPDTAETRTPANDLTPVPAAPVPERLPALAPDRSSVAAEPESVGQASSPAKAVTQNVVAEPEMALLSGATFQMGSADDRSERPVHAVTIKPFLMARYAVTVREWQQCVQAGVCTLVPKGKSDEPVTNVSWNDAQQFVNWLSQATGQRYRLPTEAEWEFAARGGSDTRYPWGNAMLKGKAGCKGCGGPASLQDPPWVYAYPPNQFGLYGMGGGVAEWVADCWHRDYQDAPRNGLMPWDAPDCRSRVLRGGSWRDEATEIRASSRDHYDIDVRYPTHGFRVAGSSQR